MCDLLSRGHALCARSPANTLVGERECVCGQRCLCNFIAKVRYGPNTDKGFVCKEYLLPQQHKDFLSGKGLPALRGKCLVCLRYFVNYLYILARTDANFKLTPELTMQTFTNPVYLGVADHDEIMRSAAFLPSHCSTVSCKDGYKPEAMLFVDEEFAQHRLQRETNMVSLSFKPVVRFCSSHYKYIKDPDGSNRVVQVGIGYDDHLDGLGFRVPLSREATVEAAERRAIH